MGLNKKGENRYAITNLIIIKIIIIIINIIITIIADINIQNNNLHVGSSSAAACQIPAQHMAECLCSQRSRQRNDAARYARAHTPSHNHTHTHTHTHSITRTQAGTWAKCPAIPPPFFALTATKTSEQAAAQAQKRDTQRVTRLMCLP